MSLLLAAAPALVAQSFVAHESKGLLLGTAGAGGGGGGADELLVRAGGGEPNSNSLDGTASCDDTPPPLTAADFPAGVPKDTGGACAGKVASPLAAGALRGTGEAAALASPNTSKDPAGAGFIGSADAAGIEAAARLRGGGAGSNETTGNHSEASAGRGALLCASCIAGRSVREYAAREGPPKPASAPHRTFACAVMTLPNEVSWGIAKQAASECGRLCAIWASAPPGVAACKSAGSGELSGVGLAMILAGSWPYSTASACRADDDDDAMQGTATR